MLRERALGKLVQPTVRDICFELPIPMRRIELREPGAKLFKLGCGKSFDRAFDLLDFSHDLNLHQQKILRAGSNAHLGAVVDE